MFDLDEEPYLGQLVYDGPVELERGFMIVGIEEVGRPGRWDLVLERVSWEAVRVNGASYGIVPWRSS